MWKNRPASQPGPLIVPGSSKYIANHMMISTSCLQEDTQKFFTEYQRIREQGLALINEFKQRPRDEDFLKRSGILRESDPNVNHEAKDLSLSSLSISEASSVHRNENKENMLTDKPLYLPYKEKSSYTLKVVPSERGSKVSKETDDSIDKFNQSLITDHRSTNSSPVFKDITTDHHPLLNTSERKTSSDLINQGDTQNNVNDESIQSEDQKVSTNNKLCIGPSKINSFGDNSFSKAEANSLDVVKTTSNHNSNHTSNISGSPIRYDPLPSRDPIIFKSSSGPKSGRTKRMSRMALMALNNDPNRNKNNVSSILSNNMSPSGLKQQSRNIPLHLPAYIDTTIKPNTNNSGTDREKDHYHNSNNVKYTGDVHQSTREIIQGNKLLNPELFDIKTPDLGLESKLQHNIDKPEKRFTQTPQSKTTAYSSTSLSNPSTAKSLEVSPSTTMSSVSPNKISPFVSSKALPPPVDHQRPLQQHQHQQREEQKQIFKSNQHHNPQTKPKKDYFSLLSEMPKSQADYQGNVPSKEFGLSPVQRPLINRATPKLTKPTIRIEKPAEQIQPFLSPTKSNQLTKQSIGKRADLKGKFSYDYLSSSKTATKHEGISKSPQNAHNIRSNLTNDFSHDTNLSITSVKKSTSPPSSTTSKINTSAILKQRPILQGSRGLTSIELSKPGLARAKGSIRKTFVKEKDTIKEFNTGKSPMGSIGSTMGKPSIFNNNISPNPLRDTHTVSEKQRLTKDSSHTQSNDDIRVTKKKVTPDGSTLTKVKTSGTLNLNTPSLPAHGSAFRKKSALPMKRKFNEVEPKSKPMSLTRPKLSVRKEGSISHTRTTHTMQKAPYIPEMKDNLEEDNNVVLASWANEDTIKEMLYKQRSINPTEIFGRYVRPISYSAVFGNGRLDHDKDIQASCGIRPEHELTEKEIENYDRAMGWIK